MNKFTTLMTMAATTAAGVALADLTPFDNLGLSQADTFSNTAEQAKAYEGELSGPAVLTVGQGTFAAKPVEKFTISFQPTFADFADLPKPDGAKVGFAFTDSNKAAYYNGTAWTPINLSSAVDEDSTQTILIELDRRVTTAGKVKARFTLGLTAVTEWVDVADVTANAVAIYGKGTIVSVNGATYTIAAEIVVVDPEGKGDVNIDFTPAQMTELASKFGCTPSEVPTKLTAEATKGANGNTALVNYVLFGKVGATVADTLVVKGNPTGGDASNVAISIPNLNPQTVSGATVSFRLQGRAKTDDGWQNVGAANTTGAFTFPANTAYRYFKVVTTITYGTAQ